MEKKEIRTTKAENIIWERKEKNNQIKL